MYGMLESHVQHTSDLITYVKGQITTLKGGESFEGEMRSLRGSIA